MRIDELSLLREDKSPRVTRAPSVPEAQIWKWLTAACETIDHTGRSPEHPGLVARFFVDVGVEDRRLQSVGAASDPSRFLPRATDADADAYARRVEGLTGGRRFGLAVNGLETTSLELCELMRRWLRDYHEVNGVRATPIATLFIGSYTPDSFGAGDDCVDDHFELVIRGPKRIRYWTRATLDANPELEALLWQRRIDHDEARRLSELVVVDSGETFHWHGTTWHTAELDDVQVSLTLSLTGPFSTLEQLVFRSVQTLVKGIVPEGFADDLAPDPLEAPPHDLIEKVCSQIAGAAERHLARRVEQQWMCVRSSGGIRHPRPLRGAVLLDDDGIAASAESLCYREHEGSLLIGSLGVGLRCDRDMAGLLDDLRTERRFLVGDLVDRHAVEYDPNDIKALLDGLYASGAVEKVDTISARATHGT